MTIAEKRELLRTNKFFNDWEIVGNGGWFVWFTPYEGIGSNHGWHITQRGRVINPKVRPNGQTRPWYEKDDTVSPHLYRGVRDRQEALDKATELSGITDWVKSPFGGYVSKAVLQGVVEKCLASR